MKRFNSLFTGITCPNCEGDSSIIQQRIVNVSGVGKVLKLTVLCSLCHYNETDFVPLILKKPSRVEFKIEDLHDLAVKVVRSNVCKLRIPELGVVLDPDPESASIISNIDDVLNSIDSRTEFDCNHQRITRAIHNIRKGRKKATIILEDPTGISTIISKKVKRQLM